MAAVLKRAAAVALMLGLAACSGQPPSRYAIDQDHGPAGTVDLSHVPDAVPRLEPLSRGGNRSPYQVLGRHYEVLASSDGFSERGVASWYGNKFHGHKTSNGEVYDMYAMSAAHKHLPLPTYVQVTNLENGRQVVVRVNDRGPFHDGRVIDLSYAAAFRLGMLERGTARVELRAINPRQWLTDQAAAGRAAAEPSAGLPVTMLQVGAFSSRAAAESVQRRAQSLLPGTPVRVSTSDEPRPLYRVRVGPLAPETSSADVEALLTAAGLPPVAVVDLP
ncbi:septal ring lytic transglycosylase RlpA family protein [Motiliproteus sediminis]|uniref:septal ring lytic transglycosylase RlpA family protein n=1 Tax=Motiliproteus sediminis TaxID=1468178 RepID=UPI002484BF62|nr:septal ring lytic transglycosylase RlpA family protein [Motiliproteus sediminis]